MKKKKQIKGKALKKPSSNKMTPENNPNKNLPPMVSKKVNTLGGSKPLSKYM